MGFLSWIPCKPKKRKVRAIAVPAPAPAPAETTEEGCGEESINDVPPETVAPETVAPETVAPETVAPEHPTVDKGKGKAIGDDGSKTVTSSDCDHEVINWSEVSYDSDRSGPSSYHPRPSRRARSPPTRLPPCQETDYDDCHPPPSSPPSPNKSTDDYQHRSYYPTENYNPHPTENYYPHPTENYYPCPTENYYPHPVYPVSPEVLYPQNEPPACYQTYPPWYHQQQKQLPEMSEAEKLAHRIANKIFGPVNPYLPGCRPY